MRSEIAVWWFGFCIGVTVNAVFVILLVKMGVAQCQ
jgi:hypothetical protein